MMNFKRFESDSIIDEALLEINKEQVLNTMKRKLNMISERSDCKRKTLEKDTKHNTVFTRFSVKYFSEVINSLSPHQKEFIESTCFKSLLYFESSIVPNQFATWIAQHVDVDSFDIVVDDKVIPLGKECVHLVLGLPVGGIEISKNFEAGKIKVFETFGISVMPSVKYFGDKFIEKQKMNDDEVIFSFMLVSLNCFLCPNSSLVPSNKYLNAFEDISLNDKLDWSKLIFDWMMTHIKKIDKSKSLGGCLFFLAVNYLDYLNFGLRKLSLDIPRITVWKCNMIKEFSKYDKKSKGVYGRRPVKDISSTCYKMIDIVPAFPKVQEKHINPTFLEMVDSSIPNMFPINIKEKINALLIHHFGNENDITDDRPKKLLIDVLVLLADASRKDDNVDDESLFSDANKLKKPSQRTEPNNVQIDENFVNEV